MTKNRNRLVGTKELENFFSQSIDYSPYKAAIPIAFAKRMAHLQNSSIDKQFLPSSLENDEVLQNQGLEDPIGDRPYSPLPGLVHRYPNRVLFFPTTACPIQCRYCFRKNELEKPSDFRANFELILEYLKSHPGIEEIILSGGDPLSLSNERIEKILSAFSKISSIKFVRFHTRTPVIIPERLDDEFIEIWNFYAKIFDMVMAIHTNHPLEIPDELGEILGKLHGKILGQSVLLKGVNDSPEILGELFRKMHRVKIAPYYLHHPDLVKGAMHFWMPLDVGRVIYKELHQSLPGWLIPKYMIEIPGGRGKIEASNPESQVFSGQLIGFDGVTVPYPG